MTIRRISLATALLALGGAWLMGPPSLAMSQQPLTLADLVRESTQIIRGEVTAVNEGVDHRLLPYTEVQVKVFETIRGVDESTLTFRQFGLQTPRPSSNGRRFVGSVPGIPRYAQGDKVLLFLGPVSMIGYRTTVGLGQGRFALRGGTYQNDVNNAGLFKDLTYGKRALNDSEKSMLAVRQGVVGADTFVSFVRRAVSGQWWDAPKAKRPIPPGTPKPFSSTPKTVDVNGGGAHD